MTIGADVSMPAFESEEDILNIHSDKLIKTLLAVKTVMHEPRNIKRAASNCSK